MVFINYQNGEIDLDLVLMTTHVNQHFEDMKGNSVVHMEALTYMDIMVELAKEHVGKLKKKV